MVRWICSSNDVCDNSKKEFYSIGDLINSINTEGEKLCIHPSDYDKPPLLLICASEKPLKTNKIITDVNDVEFEKKGSRIFDFESDLQLYINTEKHLENGKIKQMNADWLLPGDRQIKVIVKICNQTNCGEFLKLSNDWSKIHAQELLKLYGITLSNPLSMVFEYPQYGDLQQLLQKTHSMPIRCLLEAVYNLVRAVIYLVSKIFFS